jgi:hypothetical protein
MDCVGMSGGKAKGSNQIIAMGRNGIMGMNRLVAWIAACSILALPAFSPAAEMGHEGMAGKPGEMIFSGKAGPWAVEARLIDKKAHMEKSGVSAKIAARFAGERHLMMFLSDPATGKPVSGDAGEVAIAGPGKASSSKVTLVFMGDHIGADVSLPVSGEYAFQVDIESGGRKGSASFSHTLK